MRNRRTAILAVVLALAAILAFLLRNVLSALIVPPIAELLFLLRGYYHSLEQSSFWPLVLTIVLVLGISSLRIVDWNFHIDRERKTELHGEVDQMSFWLERIDHQRLFSETPYPRWYVARTLANLAVEILNRRGVSEVRGGELRGSGWSPSPDIQKYLEIALRSTPATFAHMLEAASLKNVPDVDTVIQYLESFVENNNDR